MLETAAQASLDRFPACAGFVVWLGHDTFPCAVSLALLDYGGGRKPAAKALSLVFAASNHTRHRSLLPQPIGRAHQAQYSYAR